MIHLKRITTEYVHTEDRIRLSGEVEENTSIVLWLTQRLLAQLITHLLRLIEKQSLDLGNADSADPAPASSLMQGFAQQVAQAELIPELPVQAAANAKSWLVLEVDCSLSPEGTLVLIFKREAGKAAAQEDEDAGKATLTVEAKQLRQWLGIVHAQWQQAGWPLTIWPTWMDEQSPSDTDNPLH
jgi:hypothetical protein